MFVCIMSSVDFRFGHVAVMLLLVFLNFFPSVVQGEKYERKGYAVEYVSSSC